MRCKRYIAPALVTVLLAVAAPVSAWGPDGRVGIVSAATHLLAQDASFNLRNFLRYVAQGASMTPEEQRRLFPSFSLDAVTAIQREMALLQSVRTDRIDPYYAYRLGALGSLVAQATAPLANSDATTVRAQYYADADRAIERINLRPNQRKLVDPRAYFALVLSEAAKNDQTIIVDYRGGNGFQGFARSSLAIDASRSVNAVADVWYTILTAQMAVYEQPVTARRDYVLEAIQFYLDRGNLEEVRAQYEFAVDRGMMDNDLRKAIGDEFFNADLYDRAMEEYQKILLSSPDRRDVVERVAEYYQQAGDASMEVGDLEGAREAYGQAVQANSLLTDAQKKLLEVESMIADRDRRLVAQRAATDEARELENRAEESALSRDYARAIALLHEAEARYASVTDEFAEEAKIANLGLRNVSIRLKELKQELVGNSQTLSGSGYIYDVRQLAGQTPDISAQALKGMIQSEYADAVRALSAQEPPR
jgi:tetratricopeptide (TPR) repeat protein